MKKTPCLAPQLCEPLRSLEEHLLNQQVPIEAWLRQQWQKTPPPFYCSVDIRNAGYKIAPVDTNLFPAGFNNLNPDFMSLYIQAVHATIAEICPDITRIIIIPESHSRNEFYFEHLATLQEIFQKSGLKVRLGTLDSSLKQPQEFRTPSGKSVLIEPLVRKDQRVGVDDFFPCCIILNNDLSNGIPELLKDTDQLILPPAHLGWATRLKSEHFDYYEQVINEFSEAFEFDPWILNPFFDRCPDVDFMKKEGAECLVRRAESLLERIKQKYEEYDIKQQPFVVVKADQGTYGMAVMMIRDPQELHHLNRKQRTRMSTIKGGKNVTKAIIQEGVYSFETAGQSQAVAEPVIYTIGRHVIGGFYRVHNSRGPDENLNTPGMNFVPMPLTEPGNAPGPIYIYGLIARLALLAAAYELHRGKDS